MSKDTLVKTNTILHYFVWIQLYNEKEPFSVRDLFSKSKKKETTLTKEQVIKYIDDRRSRLGNKQKDEKWVTFFSFLRAQWQLFLLLDYIWRYGLAKEQYKSKQAIDTFLYTIDSTNPKKVLIKTAKFDENVKKFLTIRVVNHYNERGVNNDDDEKKKIYANLFVDAPGFTSLGSKNQIHREFAFTRIQTTIAMADPAKAPKIPLPKKNKKKDDSSSDEDDPVIILRAPVVTVTQIRRDIALYHRPLVVYIEWLSRLTVNIPIGYALLPYQIEFTLKNKHILKLLCVVVHHQKVSLLIEDDPFDGDLSLDTLFDAIPVFPYYDLLRDIPIDNTPTVGKIDTYLRHFLHDVLIPQCHINVWRCLILMIKQSHAIHADDDKRVLTDISHNDADRLYRLIHEINVYLENEKSLVDVGFDTLTIESIIKQHFIVNPLVTSDTLNTQIRYREWPLDTIKEVAIGQAIDSMNVGATCLYHKAVRDKLKSLMEEQIMVPNPRRFTTNGEWVDQYLSLERRLGPNRTGFYNDAGLRKALALRPKDKAFFVAAYESHYSLSIGDLYNVLLRILSTPRDRARANNLLSLFAVNEKTVVDPLVVGDQFNLLLENLSAYRPILENREADVLRITAREQQYRGLTVAQLKESLNAEIEKGADSIEKDAESGHCSIRMMKSYCLVWQPSPIECIDITNKPLVDHMIIDNKETHFTLFVFECLFKWQPMIEEIPLLEDVRSPETTIQCIIEHRKERVGVKLEKRTIIGGPLYDDPLRSDLISVASLVSDRTQVISDRLGLDRSLVSLFGVSAYNTRAGRVVSLVVVLDGDVKNVPLIDVPSRADIEADRVIRNYTAYQRRLIRWHGVDTGNVDDFLIEPADIIVEVVDVHQNDVDYVKGLFNRYRSWIYLNNVEKEALYIEEDLFIPLVTNNMVGMTRLINMRSGLFGGILTLQSEYANSDNVKEVYTVSVDQLILGIERWIEGDPVRIRLIVGQTKPV